MYGLIMLMMMLVLGMLAAHTVGSSGSMYGHCWVRVSGPAAAPATHDLQCHMCIGCEIGHCPPITIHAAV